MTKYFLLPLLLILLSGCELTEPEPYQADRSPENRTEYNGLEGVAQQQKDQGYLMNKELADKCTAARVDLAVAESQGNTTDIQKQQSIISDTCKHG